MNNIKHIFFLIFLGAFFAQSCDVVEDPGFSDRPELGAGYSRMVQGPYIIWDQNDGGYPPKFTWSQSIADSLHCTGFEIISVAYNPNNIQTEIKISGHSPDILSALPILPKQATYYYHGAGGAGLYLQTYYTTTPEVSTYPFTSKIRWNGSKWELSYVDSSRYWSSREMKEF